jgi:hypothetical protein
VKGDQGDQGIQGVKGDQGDQGIQGATGQTGTTGPPGVSGYEIKTGSTVTCAKNSTCGAFATCTLGKSALGGGWTILSGSTRPFYIVDNRVAGGGSAWVVTLENGGTQSILFSVTADCATV